MTTNQLKYHLCSYSTEILGLGKVLNAHVTPAHKFPVEYCYNTYKYYTDAVVGLERTFYQASEDVGVVEVCAIVRNPTIVCPIAFPFNINFSTADTTAGNTLPL